MVRYSKTYLYHFVKTLNTLSSFLIDVYFKTMFFVDWPLWSKAPDVCLLTNKQVLCYVARDLQLTGDSRIITPPIEAEERRGGGVGWAIPDYSVLGSNHGSSHLKQRWTLILNNNGKNLKSAVLFCTFMTLVAYNGVQTKGRLKAFRLKLLSIECICSLVKYIFIHNFYWPLWEKTLY